MRKKLLSFLLCAVMLLPAAVGCGTGDDGTLTAAPDDTAAAPVAATEAITEALTEPAPEPVPVVTLVVAEGGATSFKLKTAQNNALATEAVTDLRRQLKDVMGFNVTIGVDITKPGGTVNESAKEFIIGHTDRPDETAFREQVAAAGEHAFGIHMTETKVIFTATHPDYVPLAVRYFLTRYLIVNGVTEIEYKKGETLKITGPVDTVITGEPCGLDNILTNHQYGTISTLAGKIPKSGNFKILQGGCSNDKYAWFAMINTTNYDTKAAGVYIYKLDAAKYRVLKRSEILMLDHANDITYIPETNEIAVAHCYVDSHKVTFIDADDLTITRVLRCEGATFYSIDYNPDTKSFVAGTGKTNMVHMTDKLVHKITYPGSSTELTTQGICCDSRYVYHVLYTSSSLTKEPYNMIFVNKFTNGGTVSKIILSIAGQEPENISVVNGEFVIGCNSSDSNNADIYRTSLVDFGEW